jgi:anti-anti-sigma factor
MGIKTRPDKIIMVDINNESQIDEELQKLTEMVARNVDCDIVIDFPTVATITSSSITKLIMLRKTLASSQRRLILSSVSKKTRKVLLLTGLNSYFEITKDSNTALSKLQKTNSNLE